MFVDVESHRGFVLFLEGVSFFIALLPSFEVCGIPVSAEQCCLSFGKMATDRKDCKLDVLEIEIRIHFRQLVFEFFFTPV
jgi:hypothetical protein